ncbi:MAG: hypothetical protein HY549_03450 [Elusimicrobia bacterium]|nr:hypothetical protein [Elusimicrobiota bacterium]
MNVFMLVAMTASTSGMMAETRWADSCALFLLLSGAVSLGIAGYLLARAPKFNPARQHRRRI